MRWYVSVEVREWPLPAGPTVRQAQENSCRRHRDLIHGFFTPSYSVPLPTFPLLSPDILLTSLWLQSLENPKL